MIRKGYRIEGDEKKRVIARKKGFRTKKEALESLPTLFSKKEREKTRHSAPSTSNGSLPTELGKTQ